MTRMLLNMIFLCITALSFYLGFRSHFHSQVKEDSLDVTRIHLSDEDDLCYITYPSSKQSFTSSNARNILNQNNITMNGNFSKENKKVLCWLEVIVHSFQSGESLTWISTQKNQLRMKFLKEVVSTAPIDWDVLQIGANNFYFKNYTPYLDSNWVSWWPSLEETSSLVINREGMINIISQLQFFFKKKDHLNEAFFFLKAGMTYSCSSCLSSDNNVKFHQKIVDKSILVIVSTRINERDSMEKEISRLLSDSYELSKAIKKSVWQVYIQFSSPSLQKTFIQILATHKQLTKINFSFEISNLPFNKFVWVKKNMERFPVFDYVLLKDWDIRLSGVPISMLVRHQDSLIVGPLRVEYHAKLESFGMNKTWNIAQDVSTWEKVPVMHQNLEEFKSFDASFLEMFFVLMDSSFATWFFGLTLTDTFLKRTSDWGPDFLWCGAALSFDPTKKPCQVFPVWALHEDTRTINDTTYCLFFGKSSIQKVV